MKITMLVEKEIDFKFIHVEANVRYWEDTTIDGVADEDGTLTPCRDGDLWKPEININNGIIVNWEKGKVAEIHFKVCDACTYNFFDAEGNLVLTKEGYVPSILSPKENGFGDYIIMDIDSEGKINNWDKSKLEIDLNEEC